MQNPFFVLTTDEEVAKAIESFSKSAVAMQGRSFTIENIKDCGGYWDVCIRATTEAGIQPKDLFWLGWFSKGRSQHAKESLNINFNSRNTLETTHY